MLFCFLISFFKPLFNFVKNTKKILKKQVIGENRLPRVSTIDTGTVWHTPQEQIIKKKNIPVYTMKYRKRKVQLKVGSAEGMPNQ